MKTITLLVVSMLLAGQAQGAAKYAKRQIPAAAIGEMGVVVSVGGDGSFIAKGGSGGVRLTLDDVVLPAKSSAYRVEAIKTMKALMGNKRVVLVYFNGDKKKAKVFRESDGMDVGKALACMGLADGRKAKDPTIYRCGNLARQQNVGIWTEIQW